MTQKIDARKTASELRDKYIQGAQRRYLHALVIGLKGVGKTSLAKTCPKPVLIFSFDPGGTTVFKPDIIESGEIVVASYEGEDPQEYVRWEKDYNTWGSQGFYHSFGTVIIDSITSLAQLMMSRMVAKEHREAPPISSSVSFDEKKHMMRIQDWGVFLTNWLHITKSLQNLPCHTLMFGHVARVQDGVTGGIVKSLLISGQSQDQIPAAVPEYYVLKVKNNNERVLVTQHSEGYIATTRLGSEGVLDKEEPADIKALLDKVGLSSEDKPLLV